MKLFRFLVALICLVGASAFSQAQSRSPQEIVVGYLATTPSQIRDLSLVPTINYLNERLGKRYHFRLVPFSNSDFEQDFHNENPYFLIVPSELYIRLSTHAQYGAHDIAALKTIFSRDSSKSMGSVFIVKSNRSDINSIADLKDKKVSALAPNSLEGWWAALSELHRQGYDPEKFFSRTSFTHSHSIEVVEEVLSGYSDVGVLPTCLLESFEGEGLLAPNALKVIGRYDGKDDQTPFYCIRSTKELYPGLVMASLPRTPDDLVKEVAMALFSMPITDNNEWTVSNDFSGTIELMRELKVGMFSSLRDYSLPTLFKRYSLEISLLCLLLFLAFLNELRIHYLVRKRTAQLQEALDAKNKAEEEAREGRKRLSYIERSGVISQMSNIIAHELKQPVGALINYAAVLKLRLKRELSSDELSQTVVANIDSEAKRISSIVNAVRSFAKKEQAPQSQCNLVTIINKAIHTFHQQENLTFDLPFNPTVKEAWILGDPLSLELLILNLIRNAVSASLESKHPFVRIHLSQKDKIWILTIDNSGKILSDKEFDRLSHASESIKPEGLGLGLSIVREIADMHSINLQFTRNSKGGVIATLEIEKYASITGKSE